METAITVGMVFWTIMGIGGILLLLTIIIAVLSIIADGYKH